MVVCDKDGKIKVIEVPFAVEAGMGYMYFDPFHKWSRNEFIS